LAVPYIIVTTISVVVSSMTVRLLMTIGKESVPTQLAQCWFPGLAISNAKIYVYFSNKIYGRNIINQHLETVTV